MPAACAHRVGLHQTDAAGVVFAGHLVTLAHDAYERAMAASGCDLAAVIRAGEVALPLIRIESDFRRPIRHGDHLVIATAVEEVRDHGYRVRITMHPSDELALELARVVQIHACIDNQGRKVALPGAVRAALELIGDN